MRETSLCCTFIFWVKPLWQSVFSHDNVWIKLTTVFTGHCGNVFIFLITCERGFSFSSYFPSVSFSSSLVSVQSGITRAVILRALTLTTFLERALRQSHWPIWICFRIAVCPCPVLLMSSRGHHSTNNLQVYYITLFSGLKAPRSVTKAVVQNRTWIKTQKTKLAFRPPPTDLATHRLCFCVYRRLRWRKCSDPLSIRIIVVQFYTLLES